MTTAEWRRLGQGPVKITIVTDLSQTLSREPPAAPNPPTRSTSVASLSVTTILVFARALLQSREAPSPSTPSGPIVRASSIRAVSTTLSHSSRHLSDWPAKLHFNSHLSLNSTSLFKQLLLFCYTCSTGVLLICVALFNVKISAISDFINLQFLN